MNRDLGESAVHLRPPFGMPKDRTGFSLIELVFVLMILASLVGIVLPSLIVVQGQLQARSASRRFALAHSLTRSTAIQHGSIAELRINGEERRFWVQVDTGTASGAGDTVSFHADFPSSLTMTSSRSRICFDPRGLATTRAGCEPGDVEVLFEVAGHGEVVRSTVLGKLLR